MQAEHRVAQSLQVNGVEIAIEMFGHRDRPAMLLIMGAMASMLWWPEDLCKRLSQAGFFVIRYDNRDTGRSTWYEPGEPPYGFDELAADSVAVLDQLSVPEAHIVGMSLGGMIGQLVALQYSQRVASLTAVSTSPFGEDTSDLPQTTEAYMAHAAGFSAVDWADKTQVIDFMVKDARMLAGSAGSFDETAARRFIEQDYDRTRNYPSVTNHFMLQGGNAWHGRLAELSVPLLVIHGSSDPVFPIDHGLRLAQTVDEAEFLRLEGGGHELHQVHWDAIVTSIREHCSSGGLQLVHDPARAGSGLVTVITPDMTRTRKQLAAANIVLSPDLQGDYAIIAQLNDPDGNAITLTEPPFGL